MDYRKLAIDELNRIEQLRAAEMICQDRLSELNDKLHVTKSTFSSSTPVQGGGNKTEEHWLNLMAQKADEIKRLRNVKRCLKRFDTAWEVLSERDQNVLETFYIHSGKGAAERVATREHCDERTAFRWRDEGLLNFTRAFYGEVVT